MKSKLIITGAALAMFTAETGHNFRVRKDDGVLSIKPSTRPRKVKDEFSFGAATPGLPGQGDAVITLSGIFEGDTNQRGAFCASKGKYGWYTLTHLVGEPGEGMITGITLADYVDAVQVPAEGGEALVEQTVTLEAACTHLNVAESTVRKRVRDGVLAATRDDAGKITGIVLQLPA